MLDASGAARVSFCVGREAHTYDETHYHGLGVDDLRRVLRGSRVLLPLLLFPLPKYRYRSTVTELEYRINSFDMRLATLEAHKSRELTAVRVWGIISTTDRPADEQMHWHTSSEKHPDGYFEIINAKGGALIRPELRMPVGSTNGEYTVQIESQFGVVADAWLSHAEPYQDLAAFDDFRAYCPYKTNMVRLIVRPRAGASVQMRFELVLLCLK